MLSVTLSYFYVNYVQIRLINVKLIYRANAVQKVILRNF